MVYLCDLIPYVFCLTCSAAIWVNVCYCIIGSCSPVMGSMLLCSGRSPEKHASLPLFHQHRAAEAPQKSMLLCSSSISPAQRRLPRKAYISAPLPSAPRSGGSPEKQHIHLCPSSISTTQRKLPRKACVSAPLPSAPRSGGSPEKHASLLLFHQHRAAEAPQKSIHLCPSSISTAQRKLPRKA